ncbi:unnamed protein product [marine sediment metagenome]|uniref:Uncharacterized protein n=1 Tax=marine sediment metagenome TaxID=412755 RepID=X1AU27_9ZZZZ
MAYFQEELSPIMTYILVHGQFEKNKRPPGYRDVEIVLGTKNLATIYPEPVPIK